MRSARKHGGEAWVLDYGGLVAGRGPDASAAWPVGRTVPGIFQEMSKSGIWKERAPHDTGAVWAVPSPHINSSWEQNHPEREVVLRPLRRGGD